MKFDDQDMFVTQVTNARQFLDIQIEGVRHVKESMFKQKVTYYIIKTKSAINSLHESGKEYKVDRRFNDFKRLYHALKEVDQYKGCSIPLLPE